MSSFCPVREAIDLAIAIASSRPSTAIASALLISWRINDQLQPGASSDGK